MDSSIVIFCSYDRIHENVGKPDDCPYSPSLRGQNLTKEFDCPCHLSPFTVENTPRSKAINVQWQF